jgi:hypothetical protein
VSVDTPQRAPHSREQDLPDLVAHQFTRDLPAFAARSGWARWQRLFAAAVVVGLTVTGASAPALLLIGCALAGCVSTAVAVGTALASLLPRRPTGPADGPSPQELRRYTVLVPAYREEAVIGDLVRHLALLDYPADRLEVLVLVERHDPATRAAVLAANPPAYLFMVELPAGPPQTKPRSCNYGC